MSNQKSIIKELELFNKQLADYYLKREHLDIQDDSGKIVALNLHADLIRKVCQYAPLIDEVVGIDEISPANLGRRKHNKWFPALSFEYNKLTSTNIELCLQCMIFAIDRIREDISKGMRDKATGKLHLPRLVDKYKAFIAHGGKSDSREKLCRFLTALDITPLMIEEESIEGRSVDEQAEHYLEQADCAVVLGTAHDKELKDGKLYPRRNVHIEIGRFQEKFPNRIIYLLEETASFPSNVNEKLYTRFTQESMDEALITVGRELKTFGIIRAVKPKENQP